MLERFSLTHSAGQEVEEIVLKTLSTLKGDNVTVLLKSPVNLLCAFAVLTIVFTLVFRISSAHGLS
jgi:hypothetical protein